MHLDPTEELRTGQAVGDTDSRKGTKDRWEAMEETALHETELVKERG